MVGCTSQVCMGIDGNWEWKDKTNTYSLVLMALLVILHVASTRAG